MASDTPQDAMRWECVCVWPPQLFTWLLRKSCLGEISSCFWPQMPATGALRWLGYSTVLSISQLLRRLTLKSLCFGNVPFPSLDDHTDRTPEHIESLPKNATARRGRQGAIHQRKHSLVERKGHKFMKKFFRQPAYCSYCRELLWYV